MPKRPPAGGGFSFRWGIPILDKLPFTILYHFLLEHYAELGVDPLEMMFIVHLSQFRHETPGGQASPGLPTIARLMGYKDEQQARRIKQSLIRKGLLRVTPQPGYPDIYDVAPFAAAAFALWEAEQQASTPIQNDTPIEKQGGIIPTPPTPIQTERGGLSEVRGEKQVNKKNKEEDSNRPAPQKAEDVPPYSAWIAGVILDFSGELGDAVHGPSNVTRALRLQQASGLDDAAFVEACQTAKRALRQAQAHGVANKMAYFFTVLADQLQPADGGG